MNNRMLDNLDYKTLTLLVKAMEKFTGKKFDDYVPEKEKAVKKMR